MSGGTAVSDGSTSLGRAEGAPLGADALPTALQSWLIPAGDIQVLERPGRPGEKWVLGEGARCAYKARCLLPLLLHARALMLLLSGV